MSGYDLDDCPDLAQYAGDYQPDLPQSRNPDLIRGDLLNAVRDAIANKPRNLQREIGPSGIGVPCNRWLAHKLAETPPTGLRAPMWRAAVGTAVHDHYADYLHHYNATVGMRYITECRVWIGDLYPGRPITGSFDFYDCWTATVGDLKVSSKSTIDKARRAADNGPQYDTQLDSYAVGAVNAGLPVRNVGLLRLPASGELADAVWKVRPYDPARAARGLARAGAIARMVDTLGPAAIPMQPTAEHYCGSCEFYRPDATDLTVACPGAATFIEQRELKNTTPPAALTTLAGPAAHVRPATTNPATRPNTTTPPASLTELAGHH